MKTKIIIIPITFLLLLNIMTTSGHNVNEIEEVELDVSPILRQSRYGPVQVNIEKDSTIVQLGLFSEFTIRHGLFGMINFTSHNVTYDGLEAYRIILHQDIILEDKIDVLLGSHSRVLTESALRAGILNFAYILGDLNSIDGFVSDYVEPLQSFTGNIKSQFQYKINNYIEIVRGTKQNATLYFEYDLSSYEIPDISPDDFHKKITLITKVFPQTIEMIESSTNYYVQKTYLILPLRLLPFYFQSPEGHNLNLTAIPLHIYLSLNFATEDHNKLITISDGNANGIDQKDPLLDTGQHKEYRLPTEISEGQLIPITISTLRYQGSIDMEVSIIIPSLFADNSLYAKNEYPLSANQYIIIMTFTGTVFIYKLVDYVDYRKFQQTLSYKNYDLVEKEFIK